MSSRLLTGTAIEGRRALRGLARTPGFALGVVLVLGIAIAGLVTVATAAYELFLKPLPFPRAEQLVQIDMHSRTMGFSVGYAPSMLVAIGEEPMVAVVGAWEFRETLTSEHDDTWRIAAVTHNFADVLGQRPIAGRSFAPADAEPGAPPVGLISERVWRERFGADEAVIGRELILEDGRVRVIGVMPAAFSVPTSDTELWQPLRYTREQLTRSDPTSLRGGAILARLTPGHGAAEVEGALRNRFAPDAYPELRRVMDSGPPPAPRVSSRRMRCAMSDDGPGEATVRAAQRTRGT